LEKLDPQRQGAASFENAAAGNKTIEEVSSVQFSSVPVLAKSGDNVLTLVHDEVYRLCILTRYGRINNSNFLSGFHDKYRN
jgi:hypothetical protein